MGKLNIEERVEFLIDSYNVYESNETNLSTLEKELNSKNYEEVKFLTREGYTAIKLRGREFVFSMIDANQTVVTIINETENGKEKPEAISVSGKILGILGLKDFYARNSLYDTRDFYISDFIFSDMLDSDPTENKMNTQWMLNVFTRFAKKYEDTHSITKAIQFSTEDLPMAKDYLILFEDNKRKQKFKKLCSASPLLKRIKDVTNINQYNNLSELYDAVDPFIERNVSGLLRDMQRYVDAGEALMPVRDRKFTLFIPLTRDGNVLFDKLASWCTASPGNGMFKSYTSNKTPLGEDSKIYIVIDNGVFEGKSDKVWQMHFESGQYKDKSNGSNIRVYDEILSKSDSLFIYFKDELTKLAKAQGGEINKNNYIKIAQDFGIIETLFEILPEDSLQIKVTGMNLKKMGDVSKFKKLLYFNMLKCGLTEINPSIGSLKEAVLMSFFGNDISVLPKELSYCNNLQILTLTGNPISEVDEAIGNLDSSRGGNLQILTYTPKRISEKTLNKLKSLLPNVVFMTQEE